MPNSAKSECALSFCDVRKRAADYGLCSDRWFDQPLSVDTSPRASMYRHTSAKGNRTDTLMLCANQSASQTSQAAAFRFEAARGVGEAPFALTISAAMRRTRSGPDTLAVATTIVFFALSSRRAGCIASGFVRDLVGRLRCRPHRLQLAAHGRACTEDWLANFLEVRNG